MNHNLPRFDDDGDNETVILPNNPAIIRQTLLPEIRRFFSTDQSSVSEFLTYLSTTSVFGYIKHVYTESPLKLRNDSIDLVTEYIVDEQYRLENSQNVAELLKNLNEISNEDFNTIFNNFFIRDVSSLGTPTRKVSQQAISLARGKDTGLTEKTDEADTRPI